MTNNSFSMKLIRNTALAGLCMVGLSSCNFFYDNLPECEPSAVQINFTYTVNLDHQDKFDESVHCVDLYIFKVTNDTKADGEHTTLVDTYHNPDRLNSGDVSVYRQLEPGVYKAVVYGGMNCSQSSFAFKQLFQDDDDISVEDLQVALEKNLYFDDTNETGDANEDGIDHSALELHDHFWGQSENFVVNETGSTPIVIDVMKNTNVIDIYIVDTEKNELEAHDYRMYILDDNNEMGSDNMLTTSGDIKYRPYIKENSVNPNDATWPAIQTSFYVSKLSVRRTPEFQVINKVLGDNDPIFTDGGLLNKLLGDLVGSTPEIKQDFLNRADKYTVTYVVDFKKRTWVSVTIEVDGWVTKYDNADY